MSSINELPTVLQGLTEQVKANTIAIGSLTSAVANVQVPTTAQIGLDELSAALQAQTEALKGPVTAAPTDTVNLTVPA